MKEFFEFGQNLSSFGQTLNEPGLTLNWQSDTIIRRHMYYHIYSYMAWQALSIDVCFVNFGWAGADFTFVNTQALEEI